MSQATQVERIDRQTIERRVLEIVGELVTELRGPSGPAAVTLDVSLSRDLGVGSLERVELVLRLEQAFGVLLPDGLMAEADTPRDLASTLCVAGPSTPRGVLEPSAPPAAAAGAPESARTLAEVLRWHAETNSERVHIFLREDDRRERPISYGELWGRASGVAAGLRERGLQRGDSVALMLGTEEDFFSAFFGTLLAGGVPVPLYPPVRLDRIEEYAQRQVGILRNAEARLLITFPQAERVADLVGARVPCLNAVTVVAELLLPGAEAPAIRLDRRSRPDPVHLGEYRRAEGSAARSRQHPGEHPGDQPRDRHPPRRRRRELAPAVPRHGTDRLVARSPLPRHAHRDPPAAGVPGPARALALGASRPPRHPVCGPELRLRALCPEGHR